MIIPNEPSNLIAVALTSTSVATLVVDPIASADGGAMFYFEDIEQPINKSVCDIASLEVYRGREQAIKISHNGFTLSNSGTFEVSHQTLYLLLHGHHNYNPIVDQLQCNDIQP
jgi:hypothetical protein